MNERPEPAPRRIVRSRGGRRATLPAAPGTDPEPERGRPRPQSDSDETWGDDPSGNDRRLRADKPPHWG
ncbi:hypothetical protein [Paramicrobacterium agarici]|uniref:hypothetical protein n=1 Tax=Paramicrobacterium agarici TaxID=630514 RepID=UPI001150434D|nr:hypothetical protein [Microbacterium agarici]